MNRKCACPDFELEVSKINAPLTLAQARNPSLTAHPSFQFKAWDFCPWCGSDLRAPREDAAPAHQEQEKP